MSADGKFVTFSTELPLMPSHGDVSQFRTYIYDVEQDTLREIPLTSPAAPPSDPVPNSDGSLVVFAAADPGIQDPTETSMQNIYLWERASGKTALLSRSHVAAFENAARGESMLSENSAFTDDGIKMVFASQSPAADVFDGNGTWDVFLLDRSSGQKELVSVSADGQSAGSAASVQPIISGNGRFIAFVSQATNLVGVDTQSSSQLYVRDISTGTTKLVRNKDGVAPLKGFLGHSLSFSADGRLLCFASASTDLDVRDSQPQIDIFVYDTTNDSVALVSYDSSNTAGANANCINPVISPDGRFVAFRSNASNFGFGNAVNVAYVRNLQTGVLRKASPSGFGSGDFKNAMRFNPASTLLYFGASGPAFCALNLTNNNSTPTTLISNAIEGSPSADGKWIAFTRRDATTTRLQVYLRSMTNSAELLISSNAVTAAAGNDWSFRPRISASGQFTVFGSRATNLAALDQNSATDLFVYDRDRKRLDLISATRTGATANGFSVRPIICPDQNSVVFVSFASDIAPHDYNGGSDIFASYFPAPDTDTDRIDDRWEVAEFGA
jgi:Tol biopolymer transport system component